MAIKTQDKTDRLAKILEIADRVHNSGTVYARLSQDEITRKRSFSTLTAPKRTGQRTGQRTENAVDLNRTYGF